MRIAYGYEKQDHELSALANKVMEAAGLAAAPSHFWVNMMPWRVFSHLTCFSPRLTDAFSQTHSGLDARC